MAIITSRAIALYFTYRATCENALAICLETEDAVEVGIFMQAADKSTVFARASGLADNPSVGQGGIPSS